MINTALGLSHTHTHTHTHTRSALIGGSHGQNPSYKALSWAVLGQCDCCLVMEGGSFGSSTSNSFSRSTANDQTRWTHLAAKTHTHAHTHAHTHRVTHQGVWSCSANAVLQDAVISVRAVECVITLRTEISITGWDLTVQRGRQEKRMGEGWRWKRKRLGLKRSMRFQCYNWVRGQPWMNNSKSFSQDSWDVAAVANQTRKSFLSADIKGRIKQLGYWITIKICSLQSLSVPRGSGQ